MFRLIILLSTLFGNFAIAENCNQETTFEKFREESLNHLDQQVSMTNVAEVGFNIALEVYWGFRSEITASNSMCIDKFHIYDHETTLLGYNQNAFTRFPPNRLVARNTIGPGLGFDLSFLEIGASNPLEFASALQGVLVFFTFDKKERNGAGRALMEFNYDEKASNIFKSNSLNVCKTKDPIDCYNLALYRLITFDLAIDQKKYLKKGSSLDFARLLMERGETQMARSLLYKSKLYEDYFKLYTESNSDFNESFFEVDIEAK